jgi:hypothetical protein
MPKTENEKKFLKIVKFMENIEKLEQETGISLSSDLNFSVYKSQEFRHHFLTYGESDETLLETVSIITDKLKKVLNENSQKTKKRGAQKLENGYFIAESHATNTLSRSISTEIHDSGLNLYGDGKIETEDFILIFKGYKNFTGSSLQTASMLLDCLVIKATGKSFDDLLVELPMREYMDMRGLKDYNSAKRQVKCDLEALTRIGFEYTEKGKGRSNWMRCSLYGGFQQCRKGVISFRFTPEFYQNFRLGERTKYLYMYMPSSALTASVRRCQYAYFFGRRIAEHRRMNDGKSNENIISVRTLIKDCPNFPKYEKRNADNYGSAILQPFKNNMNELSPDLSWSFIDHEPFTYKQFLYATIYIEWKYYPSTVALKIGRKNRKKDE